MSSPADRPPQQAERQAAAIQRWSEPIREPAAELRESEAHLRRTLDTMIEGCQIIGFDWRYLYVNPSAAAHGRRSVGELTGRTMMEAYPGIENTEVSAAIAKCLADRAPHRMENEFVFPDGSKGWFQLSIEPVPEGVLILSVDITSRKQAEDALRESRARFEALVSQLNDIVWSASPDGKRVLDLNQSFERVYGVSAERFMEHPELWLDMVHPEDRGIAEASGNALQSAGYAEAEYRIVRPDGTIRWIADRKSLIRDEDGRPNQIGGIARDVTDNKRLEAQLVRAQKMEAMGRLAGGVAHDFNNLLSAMFVELDLGLADVAPDHPVAEALQQVRRAAEQATGLTRQLLAFSRRQVVEPTVFSLNELVGESERMLRRLIGEDVELTVRPAADLGAVRADRGQIEQVLVNLVVNARDAMPEGGKLIIETGNALLDAAYVEQQPEATPGPHVVLTVTDTGTGMTEEVRSRIFEPFFTTKEHGKGTGLGLATCYGIVKQAGGNIGVYTEPGLGTTFRVYLPRVETTGAAPRRHTPVATLRGSETILLVEDSALLREGTRRILAAHGYRVLEAADGKEAAQLLADSSERIHLLLSDVVLPGLPGREVAKRARAVRPDIRVLFVSGYTEDVVTHQRLADEGTAFLQKPYTRESLTRKVREVLDAPPEGSA